MQQKIDPYTLTFTFDITNLFSNTPHELGKQAMSFRLMKSQIHYTEDINKIFIIEGKVTHLQ